MHTGSNDLHSPICRAECGFIKVCGLCKAETCSNMFNLSIGRVYEQVRDARSPIDYTGQQKALFSILNLIVNESWTRMVC